MIKKTLGGKMRELTAEQIQKNYDSLINTIQLHITGDRKEKVLKMYEDMKDRFMMAPASAKEHYHNVWWLCRPYFKSCRFIFESKRIMGTERV